MTCEEFNAVIRKGLTTTTVAERAAMCKHDRECQACHAIVDKELEKRDAEGLFTPERMARVLQIWVKDKLDPESGV